MFLTHFGALNKNSKINIFRKFIIKHPEVVKGGGLAYYHGYF